MNALLFILIWVALAALVFFGAFHVTRDKEAKPEYKGSLGGGKIAVVLGALLLVVAIPAVVLTQSNDRLPSGAGTFTLKSSTSERDGRVIFRETCASCHTLSAANARGVYGPNLDDRFGTPGADPNANAAQIEVAIKTGGVTGKQMPKALLDGPDAKLVAQYVAAVAGR